MYEVREALPIEVNHIADMGEKLHQVSAFSHMDYDKVQVRGILNAAVEGYKELFLRVIIEKATGQVVGFLLAEARRSFFGKDFVCNDMTLLIAEEHRGKCMNALQRIVNEYRGWAVSMEAKRIFLATTTGIDPEKTEKTYEFLGFRKIGTIHEA